jgi:hypothetical protein
MSIVAELSAIGFTVVVVMASRGGGRSDANLPSSNNHPVFACRVGALTPREQQERQALIERLAHETTHITEDEGGYTFDYSADVAPTILTTWIEMERKCCPFLRFTMEISENAGPVRLRVWGVTGVKAFIAAELNVRAR